VIVVDSSVWIAFFNEVSPPELERLDGARGGKPLAIGDLIPVEVIQGFRNEQDEATARQLSRQLRRKGITPRKTVDGIIADRNFQPYVNHLGLGAA
jgi:predicted nucleic acid-binding protein